jgi:hypothetical protein
MKTKRKWSWRRVTAALFATFLVAVVALGLTMRRRIPAGMMQDIRAGIAARNIADPDARLAKYLEGRYGPMSDPANRHKVFVDFFNIDHIKALQLMVKHSPPSQRQASIDAMSRWVQNYRQSLTPAESAALKAQFQSPEGSAQLRQATAQYNSQDVQYRGQTAAVISQLLQTIATVQNR